MPLKYTVMCELTPRSRPDAKNMPITIPEPLIFALSSPTTPFNELILSTPKDGRWQADIFSFDGRHGFGTAGFSAPQEALEHLSGILAAHQPVLPASWRTPEPSVS